ncbi:MAG: carboxypeptidase regulatory-like domain-containing protein [Sterolibacteriaceae bacterium]|nr:carboxypeptidase regulatory-like domain-containing protein [Sterolibacteriaceae bacterium]MBK9087438.1 carboxypeptidase regulatory-like domain-containing protein [Sterolibacteriaceae bacterium]
MHDNSSNNAARFRATVFAAAFGAALPLYAAGDPLPPEHTQGAVHYRSGGIGEVESTAMKAVANRYPLEVLFAERDESGTAAYEAGAGIAIRDASGKEVLGTVSEGPFLLVRLPAGRYTLTASRNGDAKTRTVTLGPRHVRVVFEWGSSP